MKISKKFSYVVLSLVVAFALVAVVAHATTTINNDGVVAEDVTRATGATGSFQNFAGDVTYEGAAGGSSAFHAAVMGHFHGDNLTNTTAGAYHAGVIGAYSVVTGDDVTGPKAGVVGAVNVDGGSDGIADAAFMAVLDGGDPGEAVTAGAAYGVQYLNANAGAKFDYGLDLSHAAVGDFDAVTYGTADVRMANGITILAGTGVPTASLPKGSLYLRTDGTSASTRMYVATDAVGGWTAVTTAS